MGDIINVSLISILSSHMRSYSFNLDTQILRWDYAVAFWSLYIIFLNKLIFFHNSEYQKIFSALIEHTHWFMTSLTQGFMRRPNVVRAQLDITATQRAPPSRLTFVILASSVRRTLRPLHRNRERRQTYAPRDSTAPAVHPPLRWVLIGWMRV